MLRCMCFVLHSCEALSNGCWKKRLLILETMCKQSLFKNGFNETRRISQRPSYGSEISGYLRPVSFTLQKNIRVNMLPMRARSSNLITVCGGTINDKSLGVNFVRKQVELQHRNLNPLLFILDSRIILLLMLCLTEA